MSSRPLKAGDLVRVTPYDSKVLVDSPELHPAELVGKKGCVTRICFMAATVVFEGEEGEHNLPLTSLEKRTFEGSIIKLSTEPVMEDLRLVKPRSLQKAEEARFVGDCDPDDYPYSLLTINREGDASIEFLATAAQLAAIAEACVEIAAIHQAALGKEGEE